MLKGKKIVLGITGSIAAYKACHLIRGLVKKGAEVQTVITPAGKEFITPITLSALTGKPVISEFFSQRDGSWHSHVQLGLWADAMVIAPATASTIGKMAHGIADNMLITTYLSMKAPVFIAPAMDLDMFAHPSTQANLDLLRSYGNHIIEPTSGELASHLEGKGRMEEPENIVRILDDFFTTQDAKGHYEIRINGEQAQDGCYHIRMTKDKVRITSPRQEGRGEDEATDLTGKRILITAGPTYEKIDPVRFIGNYSSGKMGLALADACARRGAEVTLVCGPIQGSTQHPSVRRIDVESAEEMYAETTSLFGTMDAAILCAAVADYTPERKAERKIKREGDGLTLRLKPTRDIAETLGKMKREGQVLVGFALETNDEMSHAKDKLVRKNLDFIVLNSLNDEGAGFRHDTNKITIISPTEEIAYPLKKKTEVAEDIIDRLSASF